MDNLKIGIVFDVGFSRSQCKSFKIKDSDEMRGLYIYGEDTAIVNLGSVDFKEAHTEKDMIGLFTEIVTHETLHHVIHKITGGYALPDGAEEQFIDIMVDEMNIKGD